MDSVAKPEQIRAIHPDSSAITVGWTPTLERIAAAIRITLALN
jgi:hypothetical protein